MNTPRAIKTTLVAATCALAGAGAGIAGSEAHDGDHGDRGEFKGNGHAKFGDHHRGMHRGFGFGAVHAEVVVPDRNGGFQTLTLDRGTVTSVNGDQLAIAEGTKTAKFKDVTLTIPAGAKIKRNGEDAPLSALQAGDLVAVGSSPKGTFVKAKSADQADEAKASKRHH